MKKVIVIIVLFLFIPAALGQQKYQNIQGKAVAYITDQLPILNIDNITEQGISYSSMLKCPQSIVPIEILYIIDGLPNSYESFEKIKPEDIINTKIIYYNEQYFYCGTPRDIIAITTVKSLKKSELRKLKRT